MGFELIDFIMKKKGLYEEGTEPVGDGTPSDMYKGDLEPENNDSTGTAVDELKEWASKKPRAAKKKVAAKTAKRSSRKIKEATCNECGDDTKVRIVEKIIEKDAEPEALADWFNLVAEGDSEISNEAEPAGLSAQQARLDSQKSDYELAKEGSGQSPAAEIKEHARFLRRKARRLREEADEAECKADKAEEKADKEKSEEKSEELKEMSIRYRRKSRRLREEAEEVADKAERAEEVAEEHEKNESEEEERKEHDEVAKDEEVEEAITEWTSNVAKVGRQIIKEDRKRRLVSQLVKLVEEEGVGLGTPSDDTNLDDFGADDDGNAKRMAHAAPTTEDELED